jgi:hypothetical protein
LRRPRGESTPDHGSLEERAYAALRDALIQGGFSPGEGRRTLAVRTPAGRERRWQTADRDARGGFRETQAFNTPIQGGAAEVMLAALAHLMRELAGSGIDATPVAVVHDELIVEAAEGDAELVKRLVERSMRRSRVGEVLLAEGLKWRQEETWFGARVDPDFARKRGPSSGSTPRHRRAA